MFSFPCFLKGLPGEMADLCMILSSALPVILPKYDSSIAKALLFPGDSGVPACDRPSFEGLPNVVVGLIFIAFSNATGRSLAPGGLRFLLGLPCGVETGVMKLFLFGVFGLSENGSF